MHPHETMRHSPAGQLDQYSGCTSTISRAVDSAGSGEVRRQDEEPFESLETPASGWLEDENVVVSYSSDAALAQL